MGYSPAEKVWLDDSLLLNIFSFIPKKNLPPLLRLSSRELCLGVSVLWRNLPYKNIRKGVLLGVSSDRYALYTSAVRVINKEWIDTNYANWPATLAPFPHACIEKNDARLSRATEEIERYSFEYHFDPFIALDLDVIGSISTLTDTRKKVVPTAWKIHLRSVGISVFAKTFSSYSEPEVDRAFLEAWRTQIDAINVSVNSLFFNIPIKSTAVMDALRYLEWKDIPFPKRLAIPGLDDHTFDLISMLQDTLEYLYIWPDHDDSVSFSDVMEDIKWTEMKRLSTIHFTSARTSAQGQPKRLDLSKWLVIPPTAKLYHLDDLEVIFSYDSEHSNAVVQAQLDLESVAELLHTLALYVKTDGTLKLSVCGYNIDSLLEVDQAQPATEVNSQARTIRDRLEEAFEQGVERFAQMGLLAYEKRLY
ncbi:hypothetical protein CI109_105726 [Kwoniella shandongensis]|uniref:Uncharacterized protein n=1 Tax=Kwoniella shandongensis TaxID=1734106 RepID=A0A5M6C0M1_9TREE|nr:uncharacterized protein CI109_003066 [Kwoniella shandongensis]KAA5528534.1 hypothetical protein CI109_003066 [Kwoniella shandongensis]